MLNPPYKIVIVDDTEDVCFMLERIVDELYGEEVEIRTFLSSQEAWDYVTHNEVHILISDLELPGLHGVDLLQKVSNLNRGIQTIIVTGHEGFGMEFECFMNGAEGFLSKPCRVEDIEECLDVCFGKIRYWQKILERSVAL